MKRALVTGFAVLVVSNTATAQSVTVKRPSYKPLRFEEDYRYLADPAAQKDVFDPVKYIPLGSDPDIYLSFGGEVRERYEGFVNNPLFGLNGLDSDQYILHRVLLHTKLQLTERFHAFVQLGHHRVWSKEGAVTGTEEDRSDVQQAFVDTAWSPNIKDRLMLRVGRQEMYYGSQRLVSVREGPNIRAAFDAVRAIYDQDKKNLSVFASRPVEIDRGSFDDDSDDTQKFWGIYGVTPVDGGLNADLYYLGLDREEARFAQGTADEERHSIGTRLWGAVDVVDYNFELVYQFGTFGNGDIQAWTVASDTGYTLKETSWQPRFGLRADVASGDGSRSDNNLNTFNALFPKGSYFTENALIGPANFIDIHPYLTMKPVTQLTVTLGVDFLWRQDTDDAIYRQPNIPIAGTAGNNARYTGTQPYLLSTWQIDPHASLTATYVHFDAGDAIKELGGDDSEYIGGWISYRF